MADEWEEPTTMPTSPPTAHRRGSAAIASEIDELARFRDLAVSITENAKGLALLQALQTGFRKAAELGAEDKAIIFTESRRTQDYLVRLLSQHGYEGQIVLFNGTNSDPESKETYKRWKERHQGSDQVSGSPTADMRAALVEQFRSTAKIMIATEAAAEGINLQFCSMVVNYDLPWNPQRIEQRIGRCHRYGQKHDVVVINFLNQANAADQRVFELLDEKFRLFSGVFGASDEVLGAIESGVDFERRIVDIYQDCRTTEAINAEFEQLQLRSRRRDLRDDGRHAPEAPGALRRRGPRPTASEPRREQRVHRQGHRAALARDGAHARRPGRIEHGDARSFVLDAPAVCAGRRCRAVPAHCDDDDRAPVPATASPGGRGRSTRRPSLDTPRRVDLRLHELGQPGPRPQPLVGRRARSLVDHLRLDGEDVEDHLLMAGRHRRRPRVDRRADPPAVRRAATPCARPTRRTTPGAVVDDANERRRGAPGPSALGRAHGSMRRWTSSTAGPRTSAPASRPICASTTTPSRP